jgi:hypothetical protein
MALTSDQKKSECQQTNCARAPQRAHDHSGTIRLALGHRLAVLLQ